MQLKTTQFKSVCVLGGSGFVGSAIVAKLDAAGHKVKVLTRRRDNAKHLFLLPNVEVVECNIFDRAALQSALLGCDAVINLIGILHQSQQLSFNKAHAELPAQLAEICGVLGIKRLLHMSSLQASATAPSLYLKSKAAGEAALQAAQAKLNITIFKPSIIFGAGDSFVNLFATLIKLLPVVLLVKPNAKFQPVWVEDVASCFAQAIANTNTYGQVYELAGPRVYSFRELVNTIMTTMRQPRPIIGLNDTLSYLQAFMMELLPVKLMSRDNVRSMQVDSVSQHTFPTEFCVKPAALESVIPTYLVDQNQRGAYDRYRRVAAR